MQSMDFSYDGVARQPDLAGNLAARKSGFDIAPQLIDTFVGPGSAFSFHGKWPRDGAALVVRARATDPGRVIGLLKRRDSWPAAAPKPLAGKRPTIRFGLQGL